MKKFTKTLIIRSGIVLGLIGNQIFAYYFENYQVEGEIQNDGTIKVKEIMNTMFPEKRHGIILNFDKSYQVEGAKFNFFIKDLKAINDSYETEEGITYTTLKIGDADKEIRGNKNYEIQYETYGLIRNFAEKGYEELYRNISPDFDTEIQKGKFTLFFPKEYQTLQKEDIIISLGNKIYNNIEDFPGTIKRNSKKFVIIPAESLPAHQVITLSMKFPIGFFNFDDERQLSLMNFDETGEYTTKEWNFGSIILATGGILLIIGYIIIMQFRFRKRETEEKALVPQYEVPKEISALEAGILATSEITPTMISSLFYDWIRKKYIKLEINESENKKKKYYVKKIKEISEDEETYEKKFFEAIFKENDQFYFNEKEDKYEEIYATVLKEAEKEAFKKKRFEGNHFEEKKELISWTWLRILIMAFVILYRFADGESIMQNYFFTPFNENLDWIEYGCYLIILSQYRTYTKDIRTEKGKELSRLCKGYKLFIKKVDTEKLQTLLKEDPLFFEKTLPFAAAFGLETEFIKKATPLLKERQEYGEINANDLYSMVRTFKSFHKTILPEGNTYSSSKGFSRGSSFGGGFSSGGGGGGRSGSSW